MANDRFGFPEHVGFDEPERNRYRRRQSSSGWLSTLAGLLALAAIATLLWNDAPELGKMFGNPMDPNSARNIENSLRRNLKQKNYKAAIQDCDRLLQHHPHLVDESQVQVIKAQLYDEMGNFRQAIAEYGKSLAKNPNFALALNNRAYTRAKAKVELDEAMQDVEQALKIEDQAAYIDTRGYLYYLRGDYNLALADFNSAIKKMKEDNFLDGIGEIYYHRALAYLALGEHEKAEQDLQRAQQFRFLQPVPDDAPRGAPKPADTKVPAVEKKSSANAI